MQLSPEEITILTQQVGEFSQKQLENLLENLDYYIHPQLSMFVPVYRFCEYAVMPNHAHPAYSFIYTLNLNGEYLVEGRKITSQESLFICAFSPGVMHQEIAYEEGFSNYIAIMIDKTYFEKCYSKYQPTIPIFKGEVLPINDNLHFLLRLLMAEHQNKKSPDANIISSYNDIITDFLVRLSLKTDVHPISVQHQSMIEKAENFIYSNIGGKISVEEIASHVNLSSSHFSRLFKEVTNRTPVEYINQLRIEKAKRLLKFTPQNLTQIAFDCGFTSSSYLSHCFIEAEKLTPSEYRKKFTN